MENRQVLLALIGVILLLIPAVADCQQYGQWTWGGVVGAEGRTSENTAEQEVLSKYQTQSIYIGLGINGFVVHPAIARFNLSLETWFTQFPEGTAHDNSRFGGRFDLSLLERGTYPTRLYFGRTQYSYQDLAADDPITLLGGLPDTTTTWGGHLRIRRGILRGLIVGVDASELSFQGTDHRTETINRYFADWARSGKNIQHHLRLAHEARDYDRLEYGLGTTTLTWDEHGPLTPSWRWDLSAVGISRTTEFAGVDPAESNTARLRNRFIHDLSDRSAVDLGYAFGYASTGNSSSALDHQLEARYRRKIGSGWLFSPFAAYTLREIDGGDMSVLHGGAALTWSWATGVWNSVFSSQGSYGQSMSSSPDRPNAQPFWSGSLSSILGHGSTAVLRKELEISISHNEVQSVGDSNADLPDLGIGFAAAGAQDRARMRFSLFRGWKSGNTNAWIEWQKREADSLIDETRLSTEDLIVTVQLRWRRFSVVLNGGATEIDDFHSTGQEVTYLGGSLSWNPWRSVHTTASYREDFRRLALAPDVDSNRIQGTVDFQMGRLTIRGEFFQYTERPESGIERRNRGLFWSVRRGFSGWLPFVTGPQRRGFVR